MVSQSQTEEGVDVHQEGHGVVVLEIDDVSDEVVDVRSERAGGCRA
jgi:hypothetical protein